MVNILKFQTREKKAKAERLSLTLYVQTDILEDGSIWYKIGSENLKTKEIIWDEWRKVGEIT